MKSVTQYSNRHLGFTLVEFIIVIGIFVLLLAIALPFTIKNYQSNEIISQRDTLISLLRDARNQSLNRISNLEHGVYIASESFTLFEGHSYASRSVGKDRIFPRSDSVIISVPQEILFDRYSGATPSKSIDLTLNQTTFRIYVNPYGQIDSHKR